MLIRKPPSRRIPLPLSGGRAMTAQQRQEEVQNLMQSCTLDGPRTPMLNSPRAPVSVSRTHRHYSREVPSLALSLRSNTLLHICTKIEMVAIVTGIGNQLPDDISKIIAGMCVTRTRTSRQHQPGSLTARKWGITAHSIDHTMYTHLISCLSSGPPRCLLRLLLHLPMGLLRSEDTLREYRVTIQACRPGQYRTNIPFISPAASSPATSTTIPPKQSA